MWPETFSSVVGSFLIGVEIYHTFAHFLVLFGFRLLPRKDLVRLRVYFVIDAVSVFTVSFIYLKRLQWLATLQLIQHCFYIFTWEISGPAKKVISWSSLDWTKTSASRWQWDLIVGTAFDMLVHLTMTVFIYQHLAPIEILCGVVLMLLVCSLILFNKKYAWASPSSIPAWVEKRLRAMPDHSNFWPTPAAVDAHQE